MNAAEKMIVNWGWGPHWTPQYRGGTPPRLRRGKDRSLIPCTVKPGRKHLYLHSSRRVK